MACFARCSAFVPTNRLDLSKYKPDFVTMSFYKMFGFPTGLSFVTEITSRFRCTSDPEFQCWYFEQIVLGRWNCIDC